MTAGPYFVSTRPVYREEDFSIPITTILNEDKNHVLVNNLHFLLLLLLFTCTMRGDQAHGTTSTYYFILGLNSTASPPENSAVSPT